MPIILLGMATVKSSATVGKKDFTSEVPVYDLEEAIRFVTKIHEKGLETASMSDVASGCGYGGPTSTPFFRRLQAARHFGLLTKGGAELTTRSKDYLKPDFEGADRRALVDAIISIPPYAEMVQKLNGKKINRELEANGLSKTLNLTDSCAQTCAKTFESSLKFAGMLSSDLTVSAGAPQSAPKPDAHGDEKPGGEKPQEEANQAQGYHNYTLPLINDRKVIIKAPLDITAQEIKRLQKWIEFTLQVDWSDQVPQ
jgi:hypothetical protein